MDAQNKTNQQANQVANQEANQVANQVTNQQARKPATPETQAALKTMKALLSRLNDLDRAIGRLYDFLPREAGVTRNLVVSACSRVNMAATDMWMAVQSLEEE